MGNERAAVLGGAGVVKRGIDFLNRVRSAVSLRWHWIPRVPESDLTSNFGQDSTEDGNVWGSDHLDLADPPLFFSLTVDLLSAATAESNGLPDTTRETL